MSLSSQLSASPYHMGPASQPSASPHHMSLASQLTASPHRPSLASQLSASPHHMGPASQLPTPSTMTSTGDEMRGPMMDDDDDSGDDFAGPTFTAHIPSTESGHHHRTKPKRKRAKGTKKDEKMTTPTEKRKPKGKRKGKRTSRQHQRRINAPPLRSSTPSSFTTISPPCFEQKAQMEFVQATRGEAATTTTRRRH